MDWPPTVINTRGSSGVIRTGACVGVTRAPSVLIVLRVRPGRPTLWGQPLFQCGPLQTGHGAGGGLDA